MGSACEASVSLTSGHLTSGCGKKFTLFLELKLFEESRVETSAKKRCISLELHTSVIGAAWERHKNFCKRFEFNF